MKETSREGNKLRIQEKRERKNVETCLDSKTVKMYLRINIA